MPRLIKILIVLFVLMIQAYTPLVPGCQMAFVISGTVLLYAAFAAMAVGTAVTGYQAHQSAKAQKSYQDDMADYYNKKAQVEADDAKKYIQQRDAELHRQKRAQQGRRVTMLASSGAAIDIGTPNEWLTYQFLGDEVAIQSELNAIKAGAQGQAHGNYMGAWTARRRASLASMQAHQAIVGTGASLLTLAGQGMMAKASSMPSGGGGGGGASGGGDMNASIGGTWA